MQPPISPYRDSHLLHLQKSHGSPSPPHPFMHSIPNAILKWRRIIALMLGRRGSRPPSARMDLASPRLPRSVYSRMCSLSSDHPLLKAMKEDWVARCPFSFSEYHSGLFLVQFGCEGDRRRVMEGQPWHFDRSLMIFAIPDAFDTIIPTQLCYIPLWVQVHYVSFGSRSYGLAQFVANTIGDLIEVHLASLCDVVTPSMRVRVLLDTTKPLHRGLNVHLRKLSLTKWLKLLYEGIHNYCYHCGKLDHTFNKCEKFLHHCDHHPFPPSLSYKDTLRAPAKSIYKKSIFELSTYIPFEEQPSLSNTGHASLQGNVDHFTVLTMAEPTLPTVNPPPHTTFVHSPTLPVPMTTISTQPLSTHSTVHCPLPSRPIMTSTITPSTSKGKAPMYPEPSRPLSINPPLSTLRIIDTPSAPTTTRKRYGS
ncbi:hypothetical protein G4B88_019082 [Cannabis sativa]|uniref:DUF4283 domain-containing protein n=1 Tax=Cannabis sativa TaxID=3483 RepID=A0A7J6H2Y4_CANSA|nr:hypothetical protein G4B88_019082 [Cannabis sativa]